MIIDILGLYESTVWERVHPDPWKTEEHGFRMSDLIFRAETSNESAPCEWIGTSNGAKNYSTTIRYYDAADRIMFTESGNDSAFHTTIWGFDTESSSNFESVVYSWTV